MTVVDDLGREIALAPFPGKIVSLVPSITETVVSIGKKDLLCGVTRFCVHPEQIRKEKTVVGGTKTIRTELVKKLNPHLVLAEKSENPKEQVLELAKEIPVFVFDILDFESALRMMERLAMLLDASEAIGIKEEIERKFALLPAKNPLKKALYLIWKNPWMAAGRNTFIGSMLEKAGFESVIEEGYPQVTENDFRQADVVLLSSEPYPFKAADAQKLKKEFPEKKIRLVDGELFAWYGSRMLQAADYFEQL